MPVALADDGLRHAKLVCEHILPLRQPAERKVAVQPSAVTASDPARPDSRHNAVELEARLRGTHCGLGRTTPPIAGGLSSMPLSIRT